MEYIYQILFIGVPSQLLVTAIVLGIWKAYEVVIKKWFPNAYAKHQRKVLVSAFLKAIQRDTIVVDSLRVARLMLLYSVVLMALCALLAYQGASLKLSSEQQLRQNEELRDGVAERGLTAGEASSRLKYAVQVGSVFIYIGCIGYLMVMLYFWVAMLWHAESLGIVNGATQLRIAARVETMIARVQVLCTKGEFAELTNLEFLVSDEKSAMAFIDYLLKLAKKYKATAIAAWLERWGLLFSDTTPLNPVSSQDEPI